MFQGYSNFSGGVDTAFAIISGISLFFLIGITAVIIIFIVKYNKKKNPVASEIEGSTKLEIIWTVIPLIQVEDVAQVKGRFDAREGRYRDLK